MHALALVSGSTKVLIFTCDLVGFGMKELGLMYAEVKKKCNISSKNIFVLPSHNHYAPSLYGSYDGNAKLTAQENAYTENLIKTFGIAAREALDNLKPAKVGIGYSEEGTYIRNSRFIRKDGTINWVGERDLHFKKDTGPYDPTVGVLRIDDNEGSTIATLYNYGCHANAAEPDGFTTITWDWPGYTSQMVENVLGGEALFLVGSCGNVHPIREQIAKQMGEKIAEAVIKAAENVKPLKTVPLKILREKTLLPARNFKTFDPKQIEDISNQVAVRWNKKTGDKIKSIFMRVLEGLKGKITPDHERELRVLVIGGLAMAFVPGEYFCELGLNLKKRSPYKHTFVVELLSEGLGYIPHRKAYKEAGYQPAVGARLAAGGGELIADKFVALMKKGKRG
jgi:hypothetical protein